ncbi:MAG: glycosyltransferase family 4 protein [archaeon]
MNSLMIHPTLDSEKAIANYSLKLVDNMNKIGIDATSLTYTAGSPFSLFKRLGNIREYEIVHLQHEYNLLGSYSIPFFILLPYLGLLKKGKLVVTMHTVLSKNENLKGNILKRFLRKYILSPVQNRLIRIVSNCTIVHSEFFKKILVNEYGFNPSKIAVLPQGIESAKLMGKDKAKKMLNLKGNIYLLLGSFVPDHGADIIVEQADKIGKTVLIVVNPNAVNDRNKKRIGDWLNYNQELVKKNKLENFVRFDIKSVPYDLWWKYISAADIILLPYRGGIGSGVVTDAIAGHKPVVASDILFFREMEKRFKFLKLAKTKEDYPRLIKEVMKKKNYLSMQSECNKYISEFGLVPLAKKYKFLYESIK